jgi:predicted  nucleic acid-binding Zn-ribbon protein
MNKDDKEAFAQKIAQMEDSGKSLIDYLQVRVDEEKKKRQEAEGELSIIKTTSVHNSPEMRDANSRIKELEIGLSNALAVNESHQKLNGKVQVRLTEVEEDNKKLAQQVEDLSNIVQKLRNDGLL